MVSFTPGPWTVDERSSQPRVVVQVSLTRIEDVAKPHVVGSGPNRHAVRLANARLISAAPDLYAAAAAMLRSYNSAAPLTPVLAALRAAIAKADGLEPL